MPRRPSLPSQLNVVSQMDVGAMWDRMLGEFLGEWSTLQRRNLSADEIARELLAHMEGLSESPMEDLARKSAGVAYNQGRAAEFTRLNVERVVRSEVLDAATCENCERLDNSVYEVGTDEYYDNTPPSHCLGGDRCRGFYVPLG